MLTLADPDHASAAVVGVAEDSQRLAPVVHAHRRAQLIYASTGALVVRLDDASFVLPPTRALFVPGSVSHAVATERPVALRTLYFDARRVRGLPTVVTVLAVSKLAREVVIALSVTPWTWRRGGREARLVAVLRDELRLATALPLRLPQPRDPRVARAAVLLEAPSGSALDLAAIASQTGASVRTLSRLWVADTGLTFVRWREQFRLLTGLARLAGGSSVLEVAYDLGYDSPSAFGAMFKRALGVSPGRFFRTPQASAA